MLRAFEPWHLLIIGAIATVLFGAKRLPDSARSIGQSLRILKSEVAADQPAIEKAGPAAQAAQTAQADAVPAAQPVPAPAEHATAAAAATTAAAPSRSV